MTDEYDKYYQPLERLIIPDNKITAYNSHQRLRDTFSCLVFFIFIWSCVILALGRYSLNNFTEKTTVERELGIRPL
jgi:hypothetical protein